MKLSQELIDANAKEIQQGIDNYRQGYLAALAWISGVLKQQQDAEEKDAVEAAVE